ncbi:gliding motility protein GldC [Dyadobacter beijingensis]|uniref:Gliding motility protein GldC n=1 Tax=Dyadobacter beijingensis TaxID=365489 RepID=A0ABQ2HR47_9BACT|nr:MULTISPECIES: gliding motility protein GldC [Dyadobacter]GGM89194.1 gliding motility protein GldC [Dyadobacter beijingensis]SEJ23470.1 gliding motility-associated protein GldC [Dyadobacter sp. SG02]
MKKSEIHFTVELDEKNIPEKIFWDATDNPNEGINDTRAIAIGVWDHYHRGTLKIDLWTKDMEVFEMKRFYIELMSGIADTLLTATNDRSMADLIEGVCDTLSKRLDEEMKAAK